MITLARLKNSKVARNSAASYFAFASTSVSGLLSIPVAVAYLGKEQIGLWASVSAMVGYLLWMDLGIGNAAGRMLASSIADRNQSEINLWWSVVQICLWLLGFIVMLVAILCTPLFILFFQIPDHLQKEAWFLLIGCSVIAGINFPLRAIPGFLTAEDRFYWVPVCQGILPWIQLGGFYLMLRLGHGLYSYVWGTAASQFFVLLFYRGLVATSSQRPRIRLRGVTWTRIRSLLSLSLNLSVVGLTTSIIQSVPTMILARHGGLAIIPIYTFTSRAPSMIAGLVGRNFQAFYPSLLRLHVSGNRDAFMRRFVLSAQLILALGTAGAGLILAFNHSIVSLLAGPGFFGGFSTTAWFAVGVFLSPMAVAAASLLQISGKMGKTIMISTLNLVAVYFLSVFCFQTFGMPGLAAVFTLQVLGYSTYAFLRGCTNLGYHISDFPSSLWIQSLAVTAAILLAAWFLNSSPDPGGQISFGTRIMPLPGIRGICISGFFLMLAALIAWKPFNGLVRAGPVK